jgi:hypothetical protein
MQDATGRSQPRPTTHVPRSPPREADSYCIGEHPNFFSVSLFIFIGRLCAIRLGFLNRPPAAPQLRTLKLSLLPPTNIKETFFFVFGPDEQPRANKSLKNS